MGTASSNSKASSTKKKKTMSVKFATCLLMSMLASWAQADNCSFEEKQKLKLKHQKCTEVVQQRYSLLTVETPSSRKEVSTPLALKTNSGLEKEYVCIEGANDMMNRRIVVQSSVDTIFSVLCDGMDKIVHGCSQVLEKCYTDEEIMETKIGQLELTRKIFDDIMTVKKGQKSSMVLDMNQCNAYSSLGYFTSNASSSLLQQSPILFTLLTTLLVLL